MLAYFRRTLAVSWQGESAPAKPICDLEFVEQQWSQSYNRHLPQMFWNEPPSVYSSANSAVVEDDESASTWLEG